MRTRGTARAPDADAADEGTRPRAKYLPGRRAGARGRRRSRVTILSGTRVSKRQLAFERLMAPAVGHARPSVRADCAEGPRPCPFVGCRYHLYLDVDARTGSVRLNFPGVDPTDLSESCALDVAEREACSLDEVAGLLNVSRERARQIERQALARARSGTERTGNGRAVADQLTESSAIRPSTMRRTRSA